MITLEARGIRKSYGGVTALADVDLALRPGSVHALLGENGAGKSTLVKIMTGATRADSGSLRLDGEEILFANTADAVRRGVAVVSQELSLFPHLSVLANLFPMREPKRMLLIDRRKMAQLAAPILADLGLSVDPRTLVRDLTLAQRQLVEIAKALVSNPRVLLLDEPTSALEGGASDRLLNILRVLRQRDVAVVFVTHILEEVISVCDEVTVLRDGRVVVRGDRIADHSIASLVQAMIGDKAPPSAPEVREAADAGLVLAAQADSGVRVEGVRLPGADSDVDFTAQPGEILGLVGLAGAGPSETLRLIAGIDRPRSGRITLPGGRRAPRNQRAAIHAGVAYVSGDRRRYGVMGDKPIWENIVQVRSIGLGRDGLLLKRNALISRATGHIDRIGIKVPSPQANVDALSGGNQQKVVLAKWLDNAPSTILLDDPTRGVDIGARSEIHGLLRGAARAGAAVLLCSTDLEELASACDRVLVFYRGSICAELRGSEKTSERMLHLMNTGSD